MENKALKIGLFGVDFFTANKGCEALGYSFLHILKNIAETKSLKINLYVFIRFSNKTFFRWVLDRDFRENVVPRINSDILKCIPAPSTDQLAKALTESLIAKCDLVFDFTGGDSFSDIYGKERFFSNLKLKDEVLKRNIPLVLGSQTFGPFEDELVRKEAKRIILSALEVYARDDMSFQYVRKLCGREAVRVTDVAFVLPYQVSRRERGEKTKVGFNISGLLWEGGYTRDNQFDLTLDYRKYCMSVVEYFQARQDQYELHIIPHVFGTAKKGAATADDDMIPVKYLQAIGIKADFAPHFINPMDAKTYISGMDVFIGSRMHATIAAFSSGVATIPVSYSRKFEGLYETLGYGFTISAATVTTEQAIEMTIHEVENYPVLESRVKEALEKEVGVRLERFKASVEEIVTEHFRKKNMI